MAAQSGAGLRMWLADAGVDVLCADIPWKKYPLTAGIEFRCSLWGTTIPQLYAMTVS